MWNKIKSMEDKLYDALARTMLKDMEDQYGNIMPNPLKVAMHSWAENKENIDKLTRLISKNIKIDELVKVVAEKIKGSFSGWNAENSREQVKKLVIDKIAMIIAKEKVKELK